MNTEEITYNKNIKDFKTFFKMLKKQFFIYEKIEGVDWKNYDFSIDCSDDQLKFKDMLQIRFVEELTEASIALNEKDSSHFWEEISDATNFFFSSYLMLGDDLFKLREPKLYIGNQKKKRPKNLKEFSIMFYPIIEKVGYLCNLLKNRPWAQSNYLVSLLDFKERLENLWLSYWEVLSLMHIQREDLFEMIYKKIMVNKFRIETGY